MQVGDICSRDVATLPKNGSLKEAAALMRERHVGAVIVVDDQAERAVPIGIVTDRDIVVEIIAKDASPEGVTLGDVMSFDLLTVPQSMSVNDTIELMRAKSVRRVPVVDEDDALVGIVSIDDLIGLVAKQLAQIFALIVREQQREADLRD